MRRYEELLARLRQAVLESRGKTPPDLRQALARRARDLALGAEARTTVPAALTAFVDRVALQADQISDEEVEALQAAGWSDDQLFEIITATALGASEARYEVGMRALEEAIR